ncbi:protein MIS12 homolog [Glandiceps talaboti]
MTDSEMSGRAEPCKSGDSQKSDVNIDTICCDFSEYEAQCFGFTPQSFVNGIYNALIEYLHDGLITAEKFLIQEFRVDREDSKISEEHVRKGTQKIYSRLKNDIGKAVDKLEGYLLSNVLHVPSHVLLPEDKIHQDQTFTEDDVEKVDKELEDLRLKIQNVKYMNAWMLQSMQDIEKVQSKLDSLNAMLDEIEKVHKEAGVSDLKEALVFNISRMKQLQDNVQTVMSHRLCHDEENEQRMAMSKKVKLRKQ